MNEKPKIYKEPFAHLDNKLMFAVIMLCVTGMMAVFSTTLPMCLMRNMPLFHYFKQHVLWLFLGFGGLFWFANFDFRKIKRVALPFAISVIVLLLLVKFTPLGVEINGARRWLNFGFFRFQPSELTKLAIITLMAGLFSFNKNVDVKKIIIYSVTALAMVFVVLKQPNLSMTLILLGIIFGMYLFSGKTMKYFYTGFGILLCLVIVFKILALPLPEKFQLEDYQKDRLVNRISAHSSTSDLRNGGYQVYHSLIAITSGGFIGAGYGNSKEKLGWLPEAHTDFIFSVIAEEMGFSGCLFVILMFMIILYRGMYIAYKCRDFYGKLLASGITLSITMQAFINIAVATSFFPATGVTLPFISYGGSSLLVSLSMMGVLFNIKKYNTITKVTRYN